jgi:hypothetical protein
MKYSHTKFIVSDMEIPNPKSSEKYIRETKNETTNKKIWRMWIFDIKLRVNSIPTKYLKQELKKRKYR